MKTNEELLKYIEELEKAREADQKKIKEQEIELQKQKEEIYDEKKLIFLKIKKNSFRDEFLKIIDKNYYFQLKWFLTDEYGFDIRDKVSHRLKSVNLYKTKFAIYISLHIFRLYRVFQK